MAQLRAKHVGLAADRPKWYHKLRTKMVTKGGMMGWTIGRRELKFTKEQKLNTISS